MKSAQEIKQMHMLLQAGWSKRRIAAQLGISRNTLERYISLPDALTCQDREGASKMARCQEWLEEQGEARRDNSETLRQRLEKERKLKVSRRTMERAVKKHLQEKKNQNSKKASLQQINRQDESRQLAKVVTTSGWNIGPYKLLTSGELILAGSRINMTSSQRELLLIFAKKPNQLIEQKEIETRLWSETTEGQDRTSTVRLFVHRLRQIFARGPLGGDVIRSVYGKGYVFHAAVEEMSASTQELVEAGPQSAEQVQWNASKKFGETIAQNPFYSEVHDYWPNRDPYKLQRQESLLQKSIHYNPLFEQGHLELCYIQLLQCFWGMRSSRDVRSTLQHQLDTIHHLQLKPAGWLGIQAEVQSLLLWQPLTTQRLYGTWLAETLPRGMPLFAWTRHLIFTGKPKTAVKLLRQNVSEDLCQGWLSLAMAYYAIGNFGAAEEAIQRQLKIEPSMVGPRLFLALLVAKRGQSDVATRLVFDTGLLDRPFQGVQALAAFTLAQGAHIQRAHQLLDEALATINANPANAGAIGYWGLAALELDRPREAIQLLKLSIQHRCYSAPVLFSTPFLKPYANTTACRLFDERMRKSFPILA